MMDGGAQVDIAIQREGAPSSPAHTASPSFFQRHLIRGRSETVVCVEVALDVPVQKRKTGISRN